MTRERETEYNYERDHGVWDLGNKITIVLLLGVAIMSF